MSRSILPLGVKNPTWLRFVRLETRSFYFGDPLPSLNHAINKVFECDRASENLQSFEKGIGQIIQMENTKLLEYGITLELKKGSPFEKHGRPYAIRFGRNNPPEGLSGTDLVEKYESVQKSKTIELYQTSVWFELFKSRNVSPTKLEDYLSRRRLNFDLSFQEALDEITATLKRWRVQLFSKIAPNAGGESFSFFYSFGITEVANAVLSSFISAYHGFFKESFKSYRDILEMLALSAFLDILNLRDTELGQYPYFNAISSDWWHKVVHGSKRQKIMRYKEIKEIEKKFKGKEDIFKVLNTTLFLSLTGRTLCKEHVQNTECTKYAVSQEELLTSLEKSNLMYAKDTLLERSFRCEEEKCENKDLFVVARIPVTSVLLYLSWNLIRLDHDTKKKLNNKYDEYSQFVHPYVQTIQYHPFSSDLEVKLWLDETKEFLKLIDVVVNSLINAMEEHLDGNQSKDPALDNGND